MALPWTSTGASSTRNTWTNFKPPTPGSAAAQRVAANAANSRAVNARNAAAQDASGQHTGFYSWFQPPDPRTYKPNAVDLALMRVGGNAVTNAFNNQPAPAAPGSPGGGGRGGYGGGGGGGGGPAVTQAMIDALAQALGVHPGQLGYTPLPAFQGQALPAFNTAPYDTQRAQLDQAAARDQANFNTNQQATTQAVQGAYSNPYANAQVQAGAATPQMGAGLMATAGGVTDPALAQQMNAQNAQNQGSFQDLYRVLGANQQASQNSRMQQVAMDANYGRQTAGAQVAGLQGGIATNQANAQQAYAQQQAERDYQNQLMAYQTQMQNAQGQQATNQANWTQQNATLQARLQPVLDLISQIGGSSGLNISGLMQMLQGFGA